MLLSLPQLLHEAGAEVSVFIKDSIVHFLRQHPWAHDGFLGRLLYASADVGPAGLSQLVAQPALFRRDPAPNAESSRYTVYPARRSGLAQATAAERLRFDKSCCGISGPH